MLVQTKVLSLRKKAAIRRSVACLLLLIVVSFAILIRFVVNFFGTEFHIEQMFWVQKVIDIVILSMVICFTLVILYCVIFILIDGGLLKHKDFKLAIRYHFLKNKIDKAFINTKTYNVVKVISEKELLAHTPKLLITDDYTIRIENLSGSTEKLENFKKTLSALLDKGFICETFQIDMEQNYFVAKLINLKANNQKVIEDLEGFLEFINETNSYQIRIMPKFHIDLSKTPHMLIAGETGSGKSYLLYMVIYSQILKGCEMYLVDRKKVLTKFSAIVGTDHVASEKEDIFEVVREVEKIMDDRESQLSKKYSNDVDVDFRKLDLKPLFLVIDEMGSLMSELDNKESKALIKIIQSIAQRGRASGVNLIISMQQPNANNLPTAIRDQLTFKTVLGNTDDTTKHLVFKASDLMDINFDKGQGYYTNSGEQNHPGILFVPTFKFKLDIQNLKELRRLNKQD
mgnify:CR=1 FL=1|jgi:hypothetical protein